MGSPQEFFSEASYEGQQRFDGIPFLQMLVPRCSDTSLDSLLDLIKDHNKWLKDQLVDYGAIIFRGWDLKDGDDFSKVVEAFSFKEMPYGQGEARRKHIQGQVLTANALPAEQELSFHSEMAYLAPDYPDVIMFFCETPSPKEGGTAFARGDVAYKKMKEKLPEFVEKLEKHGVVYSYVPQKGWEATFDTNEREVAEERYPLFDWYHIFGFESCYRAKATNARIEWEENGQAKVHRGPFKATLKHPVKGSTGWFNSLGIRFPKSHRISYGDGVVISDEYIETSLNIVKEDQVIVQWRKGDLVVADNLSVMHAKVPGTLPRNIYVSLCKS